MIVRRQLLKQAIAGSAVAMASRFAMAAGPPHKVAPSGKIMIPMPSMPWREAIPIGGPHRELTPAEKSRFPTDPSGFANKESSLRQASAFVSFWRSTGVSLYADFCITRDRVGRWHTMGVEIKPGGSGGFPMFYHYVSDHLKGPYLRLPAVQSGLQLPPHPGRSWDMSSPYVIWKDEKTALMVYDQVQAGFEDGVQKIYETSMRVLESTDPKLESWVPRDDPAFPEQNVIFRENYCRDPYVLWDEERRLYLLYYVVGNGWRDPEDQCVLRVRSSPDLSIWSEPKTLMPPPPGYRAAESMFVLQKDGLYYLWLCGFDWGRMSLYISEDPLNFGDPIKNRIMEQHGHTPEIVQAHGQYWMACAGIASEFGHTWGMHDLWGTYIQPLKWLEADAAAAAKITRA